MHLTNLLLCINWFMIYIILGRNLIALLIILTSPGTFFSIPMLSGKKIIIRALGP